jgi:hypothetical protein
MSQHGRKRSEMRCSEGELNIKDREYWIVQGLIGTKTSYSLPMSEGKASGNRPAQESKVT